MADHEVITRLEQLAQELPLWDRAACLSLLGLLERLKAQAWVQILGSRGAPHETADGHELDRLLTIPQVAERLAIPTGHAYELARRDVFPVVRVGKYVRVSQASLTRWIGQQTTLERRIDNGPLGLHSGTRMPHARTRMSVKAQPEPSPAQRERNRPVRSQPSLGRDRSVGVKPAVGIAVNEPIPQRPE